ncbi:spore-associated protein A [Streptomyces griseoviridis]|uniref:spore-associated protein A n=1 Tax=Streptomyces griseoviridis TaxID=45398 RepID=UPI0033F9617F
MRPIHRTVTATALAVLALGGAVAATTPAAADTATPRATTGTVSTTGTAAHAPVAPAAVYNGVCGTGYQVIGSTPVGNSGTVFVTWNQSTGRNCAVTVRNTTGAKIRMSVRIEAVGTGTAPVEDTGLYTSYAGPVYVAARGHCVKWSGVIGSATGGDTGFCG